MDELKPFLHIVFDGPPGPTAGRFVKVETPSGHSVNAGEWHERPDGYWELRLTRPAPDMAAVVPQEHWMVVAAIKAARTLIKAADDLSFAAQIIGGTAGRDAALCAAIAQWTHERDKQKQMLRIIELEGHDPEIGVGHESLPAALQSLRGQP